MKLRNDWDKLFEVVAKFIESNPPKFGLAYNDNPEIYNINYTNDTVSVFVDSPFLYEFYEVALSNQKLVDVLNFTLEHIEKHENWGDKINNFPWTYLGWNYRKDDYETHLYYSKTNSWLQKIGEDNEEKYKFIVSLLSDNKKIASVEIIRSVFYTYRLSNFSLNTGEMDKDSIVFDNILIDSINSENLHINIEKSPETVHPVSICLMDTLDEKYQLEKYRFDDFRGERWDSEYYFFCNKSVLQAIDKIKKVETGNTETVKIIGYCGDVFPLSRDIFKTNCLKRICEDIGFSLAKYSFVKLDLSDAIGIKNINFDFFTLGYSDVYPRLTSLTLPDSLLSIEKFYKDSFKNLKEINFCGSEELWNQIIKYSNYKPDSFDGIQINFNYKGENN